MANYSTLKAAIDQYITANGNNEITGTVLNNVLDAMVNSLGANYQFAGVATPSTNPGTPDQNVFHLAFEAGTYVNFNGAVLPAGISVLTWNGSWSSNIILGGDGVFDISAYRATGGTLAKYVDLAEALDGGNNIPQSLRKGGMSIKFVQSSDNKYVQYRLMSDGWSTSENDWADVNINIKDTESDFSVKDEDNNAIVVFKDGHVKTKEFDSRNLTFGDTASDLAFKDENNNAIIVFRDGHIKTKNFDSQNIPSSYLLSKFKNKKIAIIGDSICTFAGWQPSDIQGYDGETYATYYPRGDVNSANKTWWYKMAIELGLDPETDINNCSWSGSRVTGNSQSTENAYAGCSTRRVTDLSIRGYNPDIIIISISCNDWGNNVSLGNWAVTDAIPAEGDISYARAAYALMINKIHNSYPTAKVFCCTIMDEINRDQTPGWPSNNASGISTYQWNQNIREIASALGCDIIDFHHCGINYSNIADYYAVDQGLHPNDAGHTLMARKAVFELISKY